MTLDQAREVAKEMNEPRRHLSLLEQSEARGERRQAVAAGGCDGKSLRTMAEELGVGKSTVQRDQASGVPGGTPGHTDHVPDRILGADGKEYPPAPKRRRHPRKTSAQKLHQSGLELAKLLKKETGKPNPLERLTILAAVYGVPFKGRTWPALEGIICTLRDFAQPTATA
jgi:hypothetical protein